MIKLIKICPVIPRDQSVFILSSFSLEFVIVVIIVMQIWLYQVLYINRFGKSRIVDAVGLLISMYAMVYLANSINTEWSTTFRVFNTAVLLIVASLIWQYLCGSGQHPFHDRDLRAFVITLILELVAVLTGLVIGYHYGIYLCVLGGLIGFLMPITVYRQFVPQKVNFPHLEERLSLIIIITFGETLVNLTRYFTGPLFKPLSLALFVLLASLFGTYVIQGERLINHHQHTRGFVLMYSHVFMMIAILSMTAGLDYLAVFSVSRLSLWGSLSGSLVVYYGCLYTNNIYDHQRKIQFSDYLWLALILVLGIGISFIFHQNDLGIASGLALASLGQYGYLLYKTY